MSLTTVTISGVPAEPLAPMQTAQLVAKATYSDGSVRDVTTTASWTTTDANVITVSAAGLATASGPGSAQVAATIESITGRAGVQVVALPAAYFVDGREYAFDYTLDSQGRVASYRISQRAGLTYPSPPGRDNVPHECSGDLHGDYECLYASEHDPTMRGAVGTLRWYVAGLKFYEYSYGSLGLAAVNTRESWEGPSVGSDIHETTTLEYDATSGRLVSVSAVNVEFTAMCCGTRTSGKTAVTLDGQGRLQRAEGTYETRDAYYELLEGRHSTTTSWGYGATGFMERMDFVVTGDKWPVFNGPVVKSTRYTVDADGWLTSRYVRSENSYGVTTETADTYAILRSGRLVAEEQFTAAEPAPWYQLSSHHSTPQRVRYEWGRLPTEPTFVPRALTGLNGADYLGVISSHHR